MNIQKGFIRYRVRKRDYTLPFTPGVPARGQGLEVTSELLAVDHGWRVRVTLAPEGPLSLLGIFFEANYRFLPDDRIFCNGFQSWTESREFAPGERIRTLGRAGRVFKLDRFGDYDIYPCPGGKGTFHSHTYCSIRQKTGAMTLLGSLDEETGYTIFACDAKRNRIRVVKDVEGSEISSPATLVDLLLLQGREEELHSAYFGALCPGFGPRGSATGWTSWYHYYTDISESIIEENLAALERERIPIQIFQVDDGWQAAVGDWLDIKPSFPGGMENLASRIRERGFRPGLWLAPFICEKSSRLAMERGDWLLRHQGKPVAAGWNPLWSGTFYALDVYNDEFLYHMRNVFDTVLNRWGFDMVKLDFLYAAALVPRNGKPRGAVMAKAMRFLRRCAGDRLVLGCGVPLGAAFGLVDYCRVGSDVAPKWEDRLLRAVNYRERVSTANSLASTVGRGHLNGRVFVNDPDVVMLRREKNAMSDDQRFTLFLLNNIFGGLIFTSDNVARYSPETMRIYRSLFPLREKEGTRVSDSGGALKIDFAIGENRYCALANLSSRRAAPVLDEGLYFNALPAGDPAFTAGGKKIPLRPHESRCYLFVRDEFFTVSGTTAHLFPGSEILACVQNGDAITVTQSDDVRNDNTIFIRTPGPGQYFINGLPVQAGQIGEGLFVLKASL